MSRILSILLALAALAFSGCGQTFECVKGDPWYNAAEKTLKVTCDGKTCATVKWEQAPTFRFVCPTGQRAALDSDGQPVCVKE